MGRPQTGHLSPRFGILSSLKELSKAKAEAGAQAQAYTVKELDKELKEVLKELKASQGA